MSIQVEDRGNGVRVLTVSNESKRNALDDGLLEQLAAALSPSPKVRALLVRGAGGKAFCSGYDLTSLEAPSAEGALPDDRLQEVLSLLQHHRAPSVALVQGAAFGAGCDLAAACDFRIGSDDALFCMPPARLGVVYAPEGLSRLSALCGLASAKLMFLTGRRVDSANALRLGLLDELHARDEAVRAADALCNELASAAPLAVQGMKRGFELLTPRVDDAELKQLRRVAFQSDDVREGKKAFLEKRPPTFAGH